jgi:hypothetical protein
MQSEYWEIYCYLKDPTATVFSSDALTFWPPDLSKMEQLMVPMISCFISKGYVFIWIEISSARITTPPIPPGPSGSYNQFAGPNIPIKLKFDIDDPELDRIRLGVDWGDGNLEWTGYNSSGTSLEVSHLYELPGVYEVKAMSEDEFGLQSEWSRSISVSVFPGGGVLNWLLSLLFSNLFDG